MKVYNQISFEDAARIIYYMFSNNDKVYKVMMEELLLKNDDFGKCISPVWYESYRQYLDDNKREK